MGMIRGRFETWTMAEYAGMSMLSFVGVIGVDGDVGPSISLFWSNKRNHRFARSRQVSAQISTLRFLFVLAFQLIFPPRRVGFIVLGADVGVDLIVRM